MVASRSGSFRPTLALGRIATGGSVSAEPTIHSQPWAFSGDATAPAPVPGRAVASTGSRPGTGSSCANVRAFEGAPRTRFGAPPGPTRDDVLLGETIAAHPTADFPSVGRTEGVQGTSAFHLGPLRQSQRRWHIPLPKTASGGDRTVPTFIQRPPSGGGQNGPHIHPTTVPLGGQNGPFFLMRPWE